MLRVRLAQQLARSVNGSLAESASGFRSFNAASAARAGAGQPVGTLGPETSEMPEESELIWDDGSKNPELTLDNPAPSLTPGEAASWLGAGFGLFGLIAFAAKLNDKQSKVPFAPRTYPFNNLAEELDAASYPKAAA